jgi:hypothetical protein
MASQMSNDAIFRHVGVETYCHLGRHDPDMFPMHIECHDYNLHKHTHVDTLLADGYTMCDIRRMLQHACRGRVDPDVAPLLSSSWQVEHHCIPIYVILIMIVVFAVITAFVIHVVYSTGLWDAMLNIPFPRV